MKVKVNFSSEPRQTWRGRPPPFCHRLAAILKKKSCCSISYNKVEYNMHYTALLQCLVTALSLMLCRTIHPSVSHLRLFFYFLTRSLKKDRRTERTYSLFFSRFFPLPVAISSFLEVIWDFWVYPWRRKRSFSSCIFFIYFFPKSYYGG